ncbi:MAG: V-type ATP synthase subunit F [Chloroflexota bacterium]|nr:V-type ATP synthase subunit F [Chloroflexota bacterium]
MSRLIFVTRPSLVHGFQLAGVEAYGAQDYETAQEIISDWMSKGETGLLAIDDGLLAYMDQTFIKKLEAYEPFLYLSIPMGESLGPEFSRKHRVAQLIRHAIGFHITFRGEEPEASG